MAPWTLIHLQVRADVPRGKHTGACTHCGGTQYLQLDRLWCRCWVVACMALWSTHGTKKTQRPLSKRSTWGDVRSGDTTKDTAMNHGNWSCRLLTKHTKTRKLVRAPRADLTWKSHAERHNYWHFAGLTSLWRTRLHKKERKLRAELIGQVQTHVPASSNYATVCSSPRGDGVRVPERAAETWSCPGREGDACSAPGRPSSEATRSPPTVAWAWFCLKVCCCKFVVIWLR